MRTKIAFLFSLDFGPLKCCNSFLAFETLVGVSYQTKIFLKTFWVIASVLLQVHLYTNSIDAWNPSISFKMQIGITPKCYTLED